MSNYWKEWMNVSTLYELTDNYQRVLEMAEQLDEGLLKDTLESIDEAIEVKAENTAKVIKELEGQIDILNKEVQRLNERKTTISNNANRLKLYLQEEMEKVGKKKIKGDLFNIGIQNNPVAVYVTDEGKLPKIFFEEQAPKLNKKLLKEELKNGSTIAGAELRQTKGLRIR